MTTQPKAAPPSEEELKKLRKVVDKALETNKAGKLTFNPDMETFTRLKLKIEDCLAGVEIKIDTAETILKETLGGLREADFVIVHKSFLEGLLDELGYYFIDKGNLN